MGWKDWFSFMRAKPINPLSSTESRVEQATTDIAQDIGAYGKVLSNSLFYAYGNRATNLSKDTVNLDSIFLRHFGRRPGAEAVVEKWFEGIKELSEGDNKFDFGAHLGKTLQLLAEAELHSEPWECTPSLLSRTFLAWVVADLESLERVVAKLTERPLTYQQQTAIFRELCLFYDALWYKILLPGQIIKTGRVPRESIEAYRELVRQKSMELMAMSEYLPEQWRNWGTEVFSPDFQIDFRFYMHGEVPPALETEYNMIMSFTHAKDNGPVFEMLAWLHMRTREILGIVDKKHGLIIHMILWNAQANFTCELIEKAMFNIVPIPE